MKLSVIILNWNGKNLLKRFLPSVVEFTSDFDIYLVDNNSEDNSIEFTKKNFPEINIIKLSKKVFVISTPNRYYPIDFHTKIPFLHWLPKTYHRQILKIIGLSFYAQEENLNLLSKKDLILFMKKYDFNYKILNIKLFNINSNLILMGIKKF